MEQSTTIYTKLFKMHWRAIYGFVNKRLKDEDGAKDIAEDCFIKLWANMEKMENENHAKKFLYVCAKNGCFNLEAAMKRHRNEPITAVHELLPEPDYEIIEAEVLAFIAEQIELLPPQCKITVKLFIAGVKSDEIGKQMGLTRKTALNQKLKAIGIIREKLKLKFGI